jgi:hypothetical protein
LDAILEALERSQAYLAPAAKAKLAELWSTDTLLAFAVLLGGWAGLQFTPIGWLADLGFALAGFGAAAADLYAVIKACSQAMQAQTDAEMDDAAKAMAAGFTEGAIDVIAGIVGGALFSRFRRLVQAARFRLLPGRFQPPKTGRLTWAERWSGKSAGVTLERGSRELGKRAKDWRRALNWSLGITGAVAVTAGAVAVSLPRGRK